MHGLNARADKIFPKSPSPVVARAEHISLEGEAEETSPAAKQPHRITRVSYRLASPLRGCETELSILEGWYLGVRAVRPDSEPLKYQFDLRFLQTQPIRVRRISWTWLVVTLGLAALGGAAIFTGWSSPQAPWTTLILGGLAAACGSIGALLLFLRRTTESLEFRSVHGGVALVSVISGIGGARDGKKFFVELIKSIHAAKRTREQAKAQFLRDEMREHHRLRELNVLSVEDYEASKARILGAH